MNPGLVKNESCFFVCDKQDEKHEEESTHYLLDTVFAHVDKFGHFLKSCPSIPINSSTKYTSKQPSQKLGHPIGQDMFYSFGPLFMLKLYAQCDGRVDVCSSDWSDKADDTVDYQSYID